MKLGCCRFSEIAPLAFLVLGIAVLGCNPSNFKGSGDQAASPDKASPVSQSSPTSNPTADPARTNQGEPIPASPQAPGEQSDRVGEDGLQFSEIFQGEATPDSKVDVIFVLDSSSSMVDEQGWVRKHMQGLIEELAQAIQGVDYQIFLIGDQEGFGDNVNAAKTTHISWPVGSRDALAKLQQFLENPPAAAAAKLRADASKEAVIITDENAGQDVYDTFRGFLGGARSLRINGFIGLPSSAQHSECKIFPGWNYLSLGKDPKAGGLMLDICSSDWKRLIQQLAELIVQNGRGSIFSLKYYVASPDSITVLVDGKPVPPEGFRYDDQEGPALIFKDGFIPSSESEVQIDYRAKTQ